MARDFRIVKASPWKSSTVVLRCRWALKGPGGAFLLLPEGEEPWALRAELEAISRPWDVLRTEEIECSSQEKAARAWRKRKQAKAASA